MPKGRRRLLLGLGVVLSLAIAVIILNVIPTIQEDIPLTVEVVNDTGVRVELDRCGDLNCNGTVDRVVLLPGESTEENTLAGGYDPFILRQQSGHSKCVALSLPSREAGKTILISQMELCSPQES